MNSPEVQEKRKLKLESKILPSELVNCEKNQSKIHSNIMKSQTVEDRVIFEDTYTNNDISVYQKSTRKSVLEKGARRSILSARSKRSSKHKNSGKCIRFDDYGEQRVEKGSYIQTKKDSQKALDGSVLSEVSSSSPVFEQKLSSKQSQQKDSLVSASQAEMEKSRSSE